MRKVISLLLCATFIFSVCCISVTALSANSLDEAVATAECEIQAFVASGDPIVTWNSTTRTSSTTTLYDFDNNINGYIFSLVTNGEPSGYIQVGKFGDNYSVILLSFWGDNILTSMLEQNSINTDTLSAPKVYYAGNFDYFVYINGDLLDLYTGEICNDSTAVKSAYARYLTSVAPSIPCVAAYSTRTTGSVGTTIAVTGWNSSDLRSMSYHSSVGGYTNHCSPTAATNLVLYWSVTRGKTGLGTNPDTIFSYFYDEMETNNNLDGDGGTKHQNIWPAISSYFSTMYSTANLSYGLYYCSNTTSGKASAYSNICDYIDDGIPMHLSVTDWQSSSNATAGGHGVNVWGYNSGGTTDYLFITANQDSGNYPGFTLMAFNNFNYAQFVAAGYTS